MEEIKSILQKDPIEVFSVVKVSDQIYTEVEPTFVKNYNHHLTGTWSILNNVDNGHLLNYKKSLFNPLLTNGWTEVKEFHEFPDNAEVVFGYHGNNMFSIVMLKEIYNNFDLPTWHSRCKIPHHTAYFDTLLDEFDFISQMKQVDDNFAMYLKQYNFQNTILCGDNGTEYKFQVYFLNDHNLTTQLGLNWDYFCKANHFKIGQTIRFKLIPSDNTKCHVYQVRPSTSSSNAYV